MKATSLIQYLLIWLFILYIVALRCFSLLFCRLRDIFNFVALTFVRSFIDSPQMRKMYGNHILHCAVAVSLKCSEYVRSNYVWHVIEKSIVRMEAILITAAVRLTFTSTRWFVSIQFKFQATKNQSRFECKSHGAWSICSEKLVIRNGMKLIRLWSL